MKRFLKKYRNSIIAVATPAAAILIFGQKTYYALIIALFGIYAIVTTSLDLLFGYTGQISLGHAGLFAVGAYSSALLTMRLGFSSLLSLLLGTLLTAVVGILIAIPASKLVKHFLSLLMIAFGQIVYLVINSWTELTGGSLGIMHIPCLSLFGFEIDTYLKKAILVWIVLFLVIIVKKNIIDSRIGLSFIAVRENSVAARGLGIDVRKYKIAAFAISAAMTGLAGGLYAFSIGFISPETFNGTQSVLFMAMLLFGGITTTAGPVIGAGVLILVKEMFQRFSNWQGLIYAVFMLVVLFFFPQGIFGLYVKIKFFITDRKKRSAEKKKKDSREAENDA